MLERIKRNLRRRPFRVVEALTTLAAALGVAIEPEAAGALGTLTALVIGSGETAQRRTTPLSEPVIPDDHEDDG